MKGLKGQEMTLDEKLKLALGKEVGKQVTGIAQDYDKTAELTQVGIIEEEPVNLSLFTRKKLKRVVDP